MIPTMGSGHGDPFGRAGNSPSRCTTPVCMLAHFQFPLSPFALPFLPGGSTWSITNGGLSRDTEEGAPHSEWFSRIATVLGGQWKPPSHATSISRVSVESTGGEAWPRVGVGGVPLSDLPVRSFTQVVMAGRGNGRGDWQGGRHGGFGGGGGWDPGYAQGNWNNWQGQPPFRPPPTFPGAPPQYQVPPSDPYVHSGRGFANWNPRHQTRGQFMGHMNQSMGGFPPTNQEQSNFGQHGSVQGTGQGGFAGVVPRSGGAQTRVVGRLQVG